MLNLLQSQMALWAFIVSIIIVCGTAIAIDRVLLSRKKLKSLPLLKDLYNVFSLCFLEVVKRVLEVDSIYESKLIRDDLFETTRPLANFAHSLDRLHTILAEENITHSAKSLEAQMEFSYAIAKVLIYEAERNPEKCAENENIILLRLESHFTSAQKAGQAYRIIFRHNPFLRGLFYQNKIYNTLKSLYNEKNGITCGFEAIKPIVEKAMSSYRESERFNFEYNQNPHEWLHPNIARLSMYEKLWLIFGNEHLEGEYRKEVRDLQDLIKELKSDSEQGVAYAYLNIGEALLLDLDFDGASVIVNRCKDWCTINQEQVERKSDLRYFQKAVFGLEKMSLLLEMHINSEKISWKKAKGILNNQWINNQTDEIADGGLCDNDSYYAEALELLIKILTIQYYFFSNKWTEAKFLIDEVERLIKSKSIAWYLSPNSKPARILKMVETSIRNVSENRPYLYIGG